MNSARVRDGKGRQGRFGATACTTRAAALAMMAAWLSGLGLDAAAAAEPGGPFALTQPPARPDFDDSGTLAAMIPLTTPGVVPLPGDRVQTFTALSGKTVTIVVQVPHPASDSVYRVPPLRAGLLADDYFSNAIRYAQSHGYGTVAFPKDTYNFGWTWSEDSITDLTVDLQESTLNFSHTGYAVVFNGPTRVLLKNFTVDYPTLTFAATGRIIAQADGSQAVQVDSQYPIDADKPPQILAVEVWDSVRNVFAEGNTIDNFRRKGETRYAGSQIYTSPDGFFDEYPANSPVLVRYDYPGGGGIAMAAAQHVTLENVHVVSSPGYAFFFPRGDGFRLSYCGVTRTNGRPISSSQDALNFSSAAGDIIVEHGDFSYQGDDGFSAGGNMRQVQAVSGNLVTIAGDGTTAAARDVFAFFDADLQYLGEAEISQDVQAAKDKADTLTLVNTVAGLQSRAAWAIDLFMAGSRVYVSDNHFGFNRARGVYAINPYSLVQDNSFEGNTLASVLVATDVATFFQGAAAVDLQIVGNKFSRTSPDGAIYATAFNADGVVDNAVLQNIAIEGNTFDHLAGPAIQLNSSRQVWIDGNSINDANQGSYSYAVGGASTKGSIVIADSTAVAGGPNQVAGLYGPVSIDPATTDSIEVALTRVPDPAGTVGAAFGEACGGGAPCYYSGAQPASSATMACLSGLLHVRQATYGSESTGLIESCLIPVQAQCNNKSACTFSFTVAHCGGLDPAPRETSTGSALVTCE